MASISTALEKESAIYAIADAARLLSVSTATVRRWLQAIGPGGRQAAENGVDAIGFGLLTELHLVGILVQHGGSLTAITLLVKAARDRLQVPYPLSRERFPMETDTIIDRLICDAPESGSDGWEHIRQLLRSEGAAFSRSLEFGDDGEPVRYWPKSGRGRVLLDSAIQRGKPIDAATGIPTWAIHAAILAGGGQEPQEVAKWFDLPLAAVEAAVAFEESLGA